jgi:alcohol dehydrogenase
LVHSAAGGVGLWASEIAARRGAVVVGVVGSSEKVEIFRRRILPLSPRSVTIVRGPERTFERRLRSLLQDVCADGDDDGVGSVGVGSVGSVGVDLVMESLGGRYFEGSLRSLRPGGGLVTYGSTSYASPGRGRNPFRLAWRYLNRPKVDPGTLTSRNVRLAGFNLIYLTDRPDRLRQELEDCIRCLGNRGREDASAVELLSFVTPPIIGEMLDFRSEAVEALERLKGGDTYGKVVLSNEKNRAT